ncbi:MAG: NAD(P)/FAD-dependent oxidoreductase [Lachnospiraceae bacterium]
MEQVIIIGGGAAGMMAAIWAARSGKKVTLYEKNEKLGKKLFITGKGRCNLTNSCDIENLFQNVVTNSKFLYSAFYTLTNEDTIKFFEEIGLQTKIERGLRVFPVSDKSSDVIRVLKNEMERLGVEIVYHTEVREVLYESVSGGEEKEKVSGVLLKNGKKVLASSVIVATGGASYPSTGSTGDGYQIAKDAGHKVIDIVPSLVPLEIKEDACKQMQGLSLKNVGLTLFAGKKKLYDDFGEMIFTHFGMSGPLVLSSSPHVQNYRMKKKKKEEELIIELDLKPALSMEKLDARVLKDFSEEKNKFFKNSLEHLLPKKLIPIIIEWSGILPEKKVNEITREERQQLVYLIKHMRFTVAGTRGFSEAIITKGGVSVKEIDPSTMESKKKAGLYFVGEVLDLDALTGGFNLQIAWSTGYLAGISCL